MLIILEIIDGEKESLYLWKYFFSTKRENSI